MLARESPSSVFPAISHPFPPIYADTSFTKPVPTNSWISNLFYPSTGNLAPTTPDPYILRLLDDFGGNPGLSISQPSQKVVGSYSSMNNVPETPAGYIVNGVVVDFRVTSAEWKDQRPEPLITSWDLFGANIRLQSKSGSIDFPVARGMSYVTALYNDLTPQFFTQHAILQVSSDMFQSNDTYTGRKFKLSFNDNPTSTFIIYALGKEPLTLKKSGNNNLVAASKYNGPIQVTKLPSKESEIVLDFNRGTWATGGDIKFDLNRNSYTIEWKQGGNHSKNLLMYAYPHHMKSFIRDGSLKKTNLKLQSSTKGTMQAVVGNVWTLIEKNVSSIDWFPSNPTPEASTRNEIMENLVSDVRLNYTEETLKGDNYFSGKGLQKLALISLLLNKPNQTALKNQELAEESLNKIKAAFLPYLENRQMDPFRYDALYKGIVSLNGLPTELGGTGNRDAAFGHSYYNDHHYHQGYLIVTAAIIHYLDPAWKTNQIRKWTEILIQDVNCQASDNADFAQFRNWDWFAGHTWAGGIKINGALDGRDQESVPESVNFYWGMKLWGLATKNTDLVKLANLQLAVMKRATYEYFWMLDGNENRPPAMIKNKVAGIFFEQKIDYTTYFGRFIEYIHGIQQLPMTPMLAEYMRIPQFVTEEWEQKLKDVAPTVDNPWSGVLYLNYAMINPADAYPLLRTAQIDDGQTRSYSLYLAATRPSFYRRSFSRFLKEKTKNMLSSSVR
ncbi:hypothetical protein G6F70_000589 [Rhizopus microsporus]|uniref:glucan endo-1,3-beta-D-glucosidase n=1 Tax=Rhizopus azygosporus TaxID=86630 RepID=A0A367JHU2_RHIAZ|nr:hypothetical protein G6F70_000589 [Rhizopus microsporus]KAG1215710.1 hypothetical protein G6F69_000796 [Rhizopus microsporus]KAG1237975.1 hypothetical protein G6F67_000811 [Rhizopus microsporus]KAG1268453.1 hypothetical protein G6F68_001113 [Rhizopus microsporus]RCH89456.1 hypothetical protein CU097_008582 [Rhizopus azygosporus]